MPEIQSPNAALDFSGKILQARRRSDGAIVAYDLDELVGMPTPQYYVLKDRVLNARRKRYFERVLFDPAVTIPANLNYRVFDRGADSGLPAIYANSQAATGDPMSKWHTNLTGRGGEFPQDNTQIVHEMDVRLRIANTRATFTSGVITDPTVAAETNFSATALFDMLTENLYLTFYRGSQPMEEGFLNEWWTKQGQTMAFGGDLNEGAVQNSWPDPRGNQMFDRVKIFKMGEGGNFHAELTNPTGKVLTIPANMSFHINIGLRCREIATLFA